MPVYRMPNNYSEDVRYAAEILNSDCGLEETRNDSQYVYFLTPAKTKISESAKKMLTNKEIILYLVAEE